MVFKLSDLYRFDTEISSLISEINVTSIEKYDDKNLLKISIDSDSFGDTKVLSDAAKAMQAGMGCSVVFDLGFIGVPLSSNIDRVRSYLLIEANKAIVDLVCPLDYISGINVEVFANEERLVFELVANSYLDKDKKQEIRARVDSLLKMMFSESSVLFSFRMVQENETRVFSINDFLGQANLEQAEYERQHPEYKELLKASKENAEKKASKKKAKTQCAKADEDKPMSKDSWEYKAMEQKKLFQETNKEDFKKNAQNISQEKIISGRVRKNVQTKKIADVRFTDKEINVEGFVKITEDPRLTKTGKSVIVKLVIFDDTSGISAIGFVDPSEADAFEARFKKGGYAGVQGELTTVDNEIGIKVSGLYEIEKPKSREDICEYKRVELHAHTKFSEKDAVINPDDLMKTAARFGHRACAVTDHGVVQAFPDVVNASKKLTVGDSEEKFKAILGMEGYLVDDGPTVCYNLDIEPESKKCIGSICSIAIKTSGFDSCDDDIETIVIKKYLLKGYKPVKPVEEGESSEEANEFSSKDIDRSLWNPGEFEGYDKVTGMSTDIVIKEEYVPAISEEYPTSITYAPAFENFELEYALNEDGSFASEPLIPDAIEYEYFGTFEASVSPEKYSGSGIPVDSYWKAKQALDFIGDAYVCGSDIFQTLDFLRKAGFNINIEEHEFYRQKFLMNAIDLNLDESIDSLKVDLTLDRDLDSEALNEAQKVIDYIVSKGTTDPYEINNMAGHYPLEQIKAKKTATYHIVLLARNNLGLYNMYRLVSESHVNYFAFRPRMPLSLLRYFGSSLIIGSACEHGEVYRYLLDAFEACGRDIDKTYEMAISDKKFINIVSRYDYLEIQPITNNMFMTRERKNVPIPLSVANLYDLNKLIVRLADKFEMICCATTDAHFLDMKDERFRRYMLMDMGFSDAEEQASLYFRTTSEMLDEFSYLGEEKALEVVVTNTNYVADKIEYGLKPFPDGTYPPIIATAACDVRDITWTKANKLYRHNGVMNELVKERLEKELKSIIGNGFAIMYYIAYRLVKKSNNDGYIVGSRGSVGSSLVATMCGISEVNPLPPHHRCPKCNYTEFNNTGEYGSGYDLPEKNCPCCDTPMVRDGQDIPFETFLGFFGDKQPDIDLNFSSIYQPRAHKYVEYLFGKAHTFRAGTIGTYADKNARMIASKIALSRNETITRAQMEFMTYKIEGVKRTTSQHPGGIVVVPKEMDVYEFTPIQFPANKVNCGIITTHFDFKAMHDTILKLDILGHADPTVLRMLHELTEVDVRNIPIPEPRVMSLLESTDALGFDINDTDSGSATLGLSELGTDMARNMIKEASPRHFYDLVQLMGLSHGTDVWTGNAQDLIREGICDLNSVIGCRDSIMTRLIYWGLPNKDSFDIMEKVRKGKGLSEEHEKLMRDNNVPDWYIDSCKKIKYMFPKAHAAAYCISTLRVAWFKVYYPEEYYCAFFTIRGEEFKAEEMCFGWDEVKKNRIAADEARKQDDNPKNKSRYYLFELVEEMYARGITFEPISLEKSHATHFVKVGPKRILPPLSSITAISDAMAESITKAREEKPFAHKEDLLNRTLIGKAALEVLENYPGDLLKGLPDSQQMDLFEIFGI